MKIPIMLLLLLSSLLHAQRDTIFLADQQEIFCKIQRVKEGYIFYNPSKGPDASVSLKYVAYYSWKGMRHAGQAGNNVDKPQNFVSSPFVSDSIDLQKEVRYIQFCLSRGHKEFNTGATLTFVGMGLGISGALIAQNSSVTGGFVALTGSVMSIVGLIIIVDAHKWQGRAGLGLSATGIRYQFK